MRRLLALNILVLLIVGFLCVCFVQAETILGHINGTVTDAETGLPIAGATVTAFIGSSVNGAAVTNVSGYYDISGLHGNFSGIIYNVTAQKSGYYSSTVPVTMISSIDFVISEMQNFTLTPISTPDPTESPSPTIPELSTGFMLPLILTASVCFVFAFKKSKSNAYVKNYSGILAPE